MGDEKGSVLAFSAVAMVVIMLFASMAIDVGCLLTAKNQLQAAADAAALAGATGLMISQSLATNRAVTIASRNTCINQPVMLGAGDVTFPTSSQIRVQASQNVNIFFARVVGINSVFVSAVAVAEIGTLVSTPGPRPFALPDMGWPPFSPVIVKAGNLNNPDAPARDAGFYYPIAPDGPGAQEYLENIVNGCSSSIGIGSVIDVEPGNMIGPTNMGIDQILSQDPGAWFDPLNCTIEGSSFSGYTSPRVIKVPLYDPDFAPDSGRNTITVTGLAAFFIMGVQGRDVWGIFLPKLDEGTAGSGNSLLYGAKLIQ